MIRILIALIVSFAFAAVQANAIGEVILIDTFGDGGSFSSNLTALIGPDDLQQPKQELAVSFEASTTLTLSSVDVAVGSLRGNSSVNVRFTADAGGMPNPSWLEELQVSIPEGTLRNVVTVEFSDSLVMLPGEKYWLWLSALGDGRSGWHANDKGIFGDSYSSRDSGDWFRLLTPTPALRVVAVPEPAKSTTCLGFFLLVWRRRFSRSYL